MIAKILFLIMLLPLVPAAQQTESLDSLIAVIIQQNKISLSHELKILVAKKERTILNLLPSIGYDLITNRPLVHFSFGNLIAFRQQKKELLAQAAQIRIRYGNQLTDDTIACRHYYREFRQSLFNYTRQLAIWKKSAELLLLEKDASSIQEITDSRVLTSTLDFFKDQLAIYQIRNTLSAKALQISLLLKRSFRYTLPEY